MPAAPVQVLGALGRILLSEVDHLGLPRGYGGHHILPFPLRHVKILERAVDLSPDLVELFGGDVEMLVGLAKFPAGVLERRRSRGKSRVSA